MIIRKHDTPKIYLHYNCLIKVTYFFISITFARIYVIELSEYIENIDFTFHAKWWLETQQLLNHMAKNVQNVQHWKFNPVSRFLCFFILSLLVTDVYLKVDQYKQAYNLCKKLGMWNWNHQKGSIFCPQMKFPVQIGWTL